MKRTALTAAALIAMALMAVMAAQAAPTMYDYVYLGDSYSAGTGLGPYENVACMSSADAWPRYTLPQIPYGLDPEACAGATIDAFYNTYRGQIPQLEELRNAVDYQHAPNQNPSVGAVHLVTVTIGGNDVGFVRLMAECFAITCLSDSQFAAVQSKIRGLLPRLTRLFGDIRAALPLEATFLVVGYPRIFPKLQKDAVKCGWLTPLERDRFNFLTSLLDKMEMQAAQAAGAVFVNTFSTLAGHELCTQKSWMIPIGTPPYWPGGSGHPTYRGELAIAKQVAPFAPSFNYPGG